MLRAFTSGALNTIGHPCMDVVRFVLMAEEGVESFKVFSFLSDLIEEAGVII